MLPYTSSLLLRYNKPKDLYSLDFLNPTKMYRIIKPDIFRVFGSSRVNPDLSNVCLSASGLDSENPPATFTEFDVFIRGDDEILVETLHYRTGKIFHQTRARTIGTLRQLLVTKEEPYTFVVKYEPITEENPKEETQKIPLSERIQKLCERNFG